MSSREPLWSVPELLSFSGHLSPAVRGWAFERLGLERAPEAVEVLLRGLEEPSPHVALAALEALERLGDLAPLEALRAPLVALWKHPRCPPSTASRARRLLLRRKAPEGLAETVAWCREQPETISPWDDLADHAPEQLRLLAAERDLLKPNADLTTGGVVLLPRVIGRVELPAVYRHLGALEARDRKERLVWELLRRCQAEHLFLWSDEAPQHFEALVAAEAMAWLDPRDAELVSRWVSPTALRPLTEALLAGRWAEAIAWSARWCERADGEGEGVAWTQSLARLLREDKAPTELHARAAACLALASGGRAVDRGRDFSARSFEDQLSLACGCPAARSAERKALVVARWREVRDDEGARARASHALETLASTRSGLPLSEAMDLLEDLEGFPLTASVILRAQEPEVSLSEHVLRCLTGRPEALLALAPSLLGEPSGAEHLVLEALERQRERWAVEPLERHFERLLKGPEQEFLLEAIRGLGATQLLTRLVEAWRPGEDFIASVALHLATLSGTEGALPHALREEAAEAARREEERTEDLSRSFLEGELPLPVKGELRLELTCNRCNRTGLYTPGGATVHPDRARCEREGWDGITFDTVIVCKFCGAEDDYTLTPKAQLAVMTHTLGGLLAMQSGDERGSRVLVGVPALGDGTLIRRASDGIKHWKARVERSPGDTEALLRLGNLLRRSGRVDEALKVWKRLWSLKPKSVEAPTLMLDTILEHQRAGDGAELPLKILQALPACGESEEVRGDAARVLRIALEGAAEAGQPLGLSASWQEASPMGPTVRLSAVDLRRVTGWDRLESFLVQPGVLALTLQDATPEDQGTQLEQLLEGTAPIELPALQKPPPATVRSAPRPGRNDPCHCGSGRKFKKCHGA